MNAAEELEARELLRTAAIQREIDVERRNKDEEIVALAAELSQERQKVEQLQAINDRLRAGQRVARESLAVLDANLYRARDALAE